MRRLELVISAALAAFAAEASWYWPFGGSEKNEEPPRLAEILEPASTNIDAAADFMADGKTAEALQSYRRALAALDRIEAEHPDRADAPEFASVRTKRAYVSAAVDAIETQRARSNARAVVTTDTAELELAMKREKELSGELEKAAKLVSKAYGYTTISVSNVVQYTDESGNSATKIVVTNGVRVVVTNHAACVKARASLASLSKAIEDLSSGREERAAQPYFAFLAAYRARAEGLAAELGAAKAVEKVDEEMSDKVEARGIVDTRTKVSDQGEEFKGEAKARVAMQKTRGEAARAAKESAERIRKEIEENPDGRRARLFRVGKAIREKRYDEAQRVIGILLKENEKDAAALNLLAAVAAAQEDYREAERRYRNAIDLVPEDHHAYYNLARLRLSCLNDRKGAAEAYVDGRQVGGPKDKKLEDIVK